MKSPRAEAVTGIGQPLLIVTGAADWPDLVSVYSLNPTAHPLNRDPMTPAIVPSLTNGNRPAPDCANLAHNSATTSRPQQHHLTTLDSHEFRIGTSTFSVRGWTLRCARRT